MTIEMAPKASEPNQNGKDQSKAPKNVTLNPSATASSGVMRNVELTKETIHEGFGRWVKDKQ